MIIKKSIFDNNLDFNSFKKEMAKYLEKEKSHNEIRKQESLSGKAFFMLVTNGNYLVILTDAQQPDRVARQCLEQVSKVVGTSVEEERILKQRSATADKLTALEGEIDEVKGQMMNNLNQIRMNDEELDAINSNGQAMFDQAQMQKNFASNIKNNLRCRRYKIYALVIIVILCVLALVFIRPDHSKEYDRIEQYVSAQTNNTDTSSN